MSEPRALVEHFFRHEFGRLVAMLTQSLGVRRLALVEDVVQAALVQALEIWSRRGVPEDPVTHQDERSEDWCGSGDSNPDDLAATSS